MRKKIRIVDRCTPYFHWAGLQDHNDFCRGKTLLCMNRVLERIGEFSEITSVVDG